MIDAFRPALATTRGPSILAKMAEDHFLRAMVDTVALHSIVRLELRGIWGLASTQVLDLVCHLPYLELCCIWDCGSKIHLQPCIIPTLRSPQECYDVTESRPIANFVCRHSMLFFEMDNAYDFHEPQYPPYDDEDFFTEGIIREVTQSLTICMHMLTELSSSRQQVEHQVDLLKPYFLAYFRRMSDQHAPNKLLSGFDMFMDDFLFALFAFAQGDPEYPLETLGRITLDWLKKSCRRYQLGSRTIKPCLAPFTPAWHRSPLPCRMALLAERWLSCRTVRETRLDMLQLPAFTPPEG